MVYYNTWYFRIILILYLFWIQRYELLIINDKNITKESLETPPVIGTSRLPSSSQEIESNSMNVNSSTKANNYKVINEIREHREEMVSLNENRSDNHTYESAATTSNENRAIINADKKYSRNSSKNIETDFKPFIPSTLFISEKPILETYNKENKDHFFKYNDFKSSVPVKQELFYPSNFNKYPTYGQIHGVDEYEIPPYSKFYEKEKFPIHATTYAPSKINPMQRPLLTYKNKKKYPFVNTNEEIWKTNEFLHGHRDKYPLNFDISSQFIDHEHFTDDYYNIFNKPLSKDKTAMKTGLLQILTTLIPIGLLLSALPPRVIFINSTNSPAENDPKPFFRNIEAELTRMSHFNDTSYNLVSNMGLTPSDDPLCNKRIICESALNGTLPENSLANVNLWNLLSRSSNIIRMKVNLQDVFEAVLEKQCSNFKCSEKDEKNTEI